jgi:hypothetical protein
MWLLSPIRTWRFFPRPEREGPPEPVIEVDPNGLPVPKWIGAYKDPNWLPHIHHYKPNIDPKTGKIIMDKVCRAPGWVIRNGRQIYVNDINRERPGQVYLDPRVPWANDPDVTQNGGRIGSFRDIPRYTR